MRCFLRLAGFVSLALVATLLVGTGQRSVASPSLFSGRCGACHSDDSATCVGCHRHRGVLCATADQATYLPGQTVTVTFGGGGLGGWIRALLYDHNGIEVARAAGPTETGDDGLGGAVEFPVQMQAAAPMEMGEYVWNAAWYGSNDLGTDHIERTTPVTILVEVDTGVDEDWPAQLSGTELRLAGFPNPLRAHSTLRLAVGPDVVQASLYILDASGRHVRTLEGEIAGPVRRDVVWDGRDDDGQRVTTGTYFAHLTTRGRTVSHPLIVLR